MKELNDELNRTVEFIKLADSKIGYISVVFLAMLGFWVAKVDYIKTHLSVLNALFYFVVFIILALLSYNIFKCLSPSLLIKNVSPPSVIYYHDIAKLDIETFKKTRSTTNEQELKESYINQIFITSIIASKKMARARDASWLIFILSFLTLVLYIIA